MVLSSGKHNELLQVFLIVAGVIVGVGAAGLVGLLTWRWRRTQADAARAMPPLPRRWRGPPSRSQRRGQCTPYPLNSRANYPPRFISTFTACPPRRSPPSCGARTSHDWRRLAKGLARPGKARVASVHV